MTAPRPFPLADVLSLTTGRLLTHRTPHPGAALDDLLHHMTGQHLAWWQAPRAADACTAALTTQHPFLADLTPPPGADAPDLYAWLVEAERVHGTELPVAPLTDWAPQHPAQELLDLTELAALSTTDTPRLSLPRVTVDTRALNAAMARLQPPRLDPAAFARITDRMRQATESMRVAVPQLQASLAAAAQALRRLPTDPA